VIGADRLVLSGAVYETARRRMPLWHRLAQASWRLIRFWLIAAVVGGLIGVAIGVLGR